MIKREDLKKAIDAISSRNQQIGFALDELLASGRIDIPKEHQNKRESKEIFFWFDQEPVWIRKISYFNQGTSPIEERLLIKFGELAHKEKLQEEGFQKDFVSAVDQIHQAGLNLLVEQEIDLALKKVQKSYKNKRIEFHHKDLERLNKLQDRLLSLKNKDSGHDLLQENSPNLIYKGLVSIDRPAGFMYFPYCFQALKQIAELNLEFFTVRFILNCLLEGLDDHLFACLVNGYLVGICFIDFYQKAFYSRLEIKYMSTVRGLPQAEQGINLPQIKGAGTFLIASLWLLWKNKVLRFREIFLNSELEVSQFYESIGFQVRYGFEYVLARPKGHLLTSILNLINNCPQLSESLLLEFRKLVQAEIKDLVKRDKRQKDPDKNKLTRIFIIKCLETRTHDELAKIAVHYLLKNKNRLSESRDLLDIARKHGRIQINDVQDRTQTPLLIAFDQRFCQHLAGVFHLESSKRMEVVGEILKDKRISESYEPIKIRSACPEELLMFHTPEYLDRVARSKGKRLTTFDPETQATENSYDIALLAVGAVFSLLDEILKRKTSKGFAFIRPPGHHAEANMAMGFCLFNNVVLGAKYLQKHYSLQRIMIVDIDAHHGNGIQTAFDETDQVLFISLHQSPAFPGTGNLEEIGLGEGLGFTINVPMPRGQNEFDYAHILDRMVRPLAEAYQPEIILVPFGFDLYTHDRLANMNVSAPGYSLITHFLLEIAEQVCQGRIVFVLEGGYSLEGIEQCGLATLQVLNGSCRPSLELIDKVIYTPRDKLGYLKKVIELQSQYWQCLR